MGASSSYPAALPDGYSQVLVHGLPPAMSCQPMMETILEQAKLEDGVASFNIDSDGKVLITLSSWMWACKCMQHFDGRNWHSSGEPVRALLLPTFESTELSSMASSTYQELKVKTFNADAPVFTPANELSKTAPVFETACGNKTRHEGTYSDATTEVSEESCESIESCASESDDWLA